ncbi:MAG: hypothetical protein JSW50_16590 [Candidatus Latescibacterota bacterium]|nr:MAG: hypothetical protein JSW50_16590 [Candidatus Latescibacterota bacterium]
MNVLVSKIALAVIFVLTVPLAIGSCGEKVSDIQSDPSFTAVSLRKGGVANLGCTSVAAPEVDEIKISGRFSDPLNRAFYKHYPNTKVLTWGNVRKMIGDDNILAYLESVRTTRQLATVHLDSLAAAIGLDSQYLVIQRIESDQLEFEKDEIKETDEFGNEKHTQDGLKTIRKINVYFGIYDLDRSELVWSATVQREDSNYRKVRAGIDLDIDGILGLAVDVAEAIDEHTDPDKYKPFPKPPSQIEVMTLIYGEFAEHLPRD